ncbi:SHOCT domain-containing protein [Luteimonas sp. MC1572]|uniref:SHOCT domain-containing protein n=1 Tax=Luteimonas sp. MC1572 TaxID=2799325 RepID=UPI0018F07854|nr:SHOCT domain-containing protein [Luteimonas sp. MC1572]MBJ6980905.1 SHOCT domain-containing protein [Luteimonas sp. MC1572]QQO02261.1 SHOCT domain-containing protein [Luteimonas sp. MC1572]
MKTALRIMLLAACLVAAPAFAARIVAEDYAMRVPAASTPGTDIRITLIDSRPYVLDGDSDESYEGMSRELYGIPISRNTADRTPLAMYIGERLRLGFERAGYSATLVPSPKGTAAAERSRAMSHDGPGLLMVITLREWSYDQGFASPEFTHDVTIDSYDAQGDWLATQDFKGVDPMPRGGWKHFKRRYAELYQDIFDRFLASPVVLAGLAGERTETVPAPAAPATPSQTIEARLAALKELRESGAIDESAYQAQQQRILSEL